MAKDAGKVRIIGGQWRSRIIRFHAVKHLRPSPDAVRETLFNWLREDISGSRCLDLFAGSGALGFEAASRGASTVTMIERHPHAARQLRQNVKLLQAESFIQVLTIAAEKFLEDHQNRFDILFIDPPFDRELLARSCHLINRHQILAKGGLAYLETRANRDLLPIPDTWHIIRQKRCGVVQSTLIRNQPDNE